MTGDKASTIGWRPVHLDVEDRLLHIGGVGVWSAEWRATGEPPIELPHPAYPGQRHRFDIYVAGNETNRIRFAAGELSNGVWAFYLPTPYTTVATGVSADRSIRFEQRIGEWLGHRYDSTGAWVVLTDATTGALLVDCGAWDSSSVIADDDALILRLSQSGVDQVFRIDPPARSFHDVLDAARSHPLAELASAVERAFRADRSHLYRRISPKGSILVDLASTEWSNSHWVNAPRVIDLTSGAVVLDLWNTDWDAAVSFPAERVVHLGLRRYRTRGSCAVELDLDANAYRIVAPSAGPAGPLAETEAAITRAAALSAGAAPRPAIHRSSFAAWRSALLILGFAAVVIAAVALWARHEAKAPQQLTPLPRMPDLSQPQR